MVMTHLSEFDLTCRQERSANAEKGLGRAEVLRGREGKEQEYSPTEDRHRGRYIGTSKARS